MFSADPADAFTQLVDGFSDETTVGDMVDWLTDEVVSDIATFIEGSALESGSIDAEWVEEKVEDPDPYDSDKRRFAILLGLDRALAHVHPHVASYDAGQLTPIAVRYVETGRLSTDDVSGALLPRMCHPGRPEVAPENIADAFVHVVRVAEDVWGEASHLTLANRADFGRLQREQGIHIGCAPMLESPDDVEFVRTTEGTANLFEIRPKPAVVIGRIPLVLRRLDEQGADIGLCPELCLDDTILEAWQEAVLETAPDPGSNLRWILVGTGPVGPEDPPNNRAVLIDRRTGEILLEQDKVHRFTMSSEQLDAWGLSAELGPGPVAERITCGSSVRIAETRLGRLAILICEDLARTLQLGRTLFAHGTSHIPVPVFAAEIEQYHWEHDHAGDYVQQVGSLVVVANSTVVPRQLGKAGPIQFCLAHSPEDFAIGSGEDGSAIHLFRLSGEAALSATPRFHH